MAAACGSSTLAQASSDQVNGGFSDYRLARPVNNAQTKTDAQPFNLNAEKNRNRLFDNPVGAPPVLDVSAPPSMPPVLDVNDPNHFRLLANFQVELIVDRSLSMRRRDCPGGLSRWNWCGVQAQELAGALYPYAPNGLTITAFAWRHDVYQQVSVGVLANIFQRSNFSFGTRLAEPLTDRLNSFFNRRVQDPRPLLIAVITDGVPVPVPEPVMVRKELIAASKAMKGPNEVTVVFLQIGGNDNVGHHFLQDLDVNLVRHGAKFPYVHTVPFERLVQIGLARALVETVQTFAARQH